MVFSSLLFSFFFLPAVLLLYYLLKGKQRNYVLLIASLGFYAFGEPYFVVIMLISIVINYYMAIRIDAAMEVESRAKAKIYLIVSLIVNIGILFIFKYFNFSIRILNDIFGINIYTPNIALPIGISFFTFQAISYIVDVYKGSVKVQQNIFNLALYISFFPQLIAGPIVRYSTISEQIDKRECNLEMFAEGIRRFLLGFSKKVLLANNLGVMASEIFSLDVENTNPIVLWIGSISFSLQIFYDFSGYSDMAIGLGKMFGFSFEENFNYPYVSKTVTEFWRRWHISLGSWFRDYVYIPLGGSKVNLLKHIRNLFVVWLLTGIWHGANYTFIIWGLWYFALLIFEKKVIKVERITNPVIILLWRVVSLLCINWGWVIFNSTSISSGFDYCLSMIGFGSAKGGIDGSVIRYVREFGVFLVLGIIFATPVMVIISKKLEIIKNRFFCYIFDIGTPIIYGILFLLSVSYIIIGLHNPFIYFNF